MKWSSMGGQEEERERGRREREREIGDRGRDRREEWGGLLA